MFVEVLIGQPNADRIHTMYQFPVDAKENPTFKGKIVENCRVLRSMLSYFAALLDQKVDQFSRYEMHFALSRRGKNKIQATGELATISFRENLFERKLRTSQ